MSHVLAQGSFVARFAAYCRERFPLVQHGAVIAAFVAATASCAAALQRDPAPGQPRAMAIGFAVALLAFLQLRIADEFKDAADDARFRPERPVPRGLVTLRELGGVALVAAAVQIMLCALAGHAAIGWLLATFAWVALMTREFFAARWLRRHPLAYLASHTVVVPLIAVTIAACGGTAPDVVRLAPFLLLAYASSTVFEFGRKIRAPADERVGVETYTALWGLRGALLAWGLALLASAAFAMAVASRFGSAPIVLAITAAALVVAGGVARRFIAQPLPGRGRRFEVLSGVWLIGLYVLLAGLALHAAA